MLVQDFLNNWVKTYGKYNLKLTTRTEYERHINQYINPRIGLMDLEDLKPLILQNLYYELLEYGRQRGDMTKPLNAKTVLQTHRIIHKALKNAVQLELINSNPADSVELPRKQKFKYNIILGDELKDFINAFKGYHIYEAVLLTVLLGLRRGELLALKFGDIDYKEKTLTIDKTLVYSKGEVKLDTTKTESSDRIILLSNEVLDIFDKMRYLIGRSERDDTYIIRNKQNKSYNPASFARLYTFTRDTLKLPKVRFHDLRHIHATILHNSNIQPKVIQERLGHSNISTTLDIYTHLFKQDQKEASEAITKYILD